MNKNFLVISNNSFSATSNNGKTLESIFSSFNKENIFQLYFRNIENPDYFFCNNYIYASPFKLHYNPVTIFPKTNSNFKLINFLNKLESYKYFIVDLIWSISPINKNPILSFCKNKNISFVFFLGGPYKYSHDLAIFVSKNMQIPLFFYLTDDYLFSSFSSKRFFARFFYERLINLYKNTIINSSQCFVIGEKMANDYSDFFNVDFKILINSISIQEDFPINQYQSKFVISFFGSLHSNRDLMLKRFLTIVSSYFDHDLSKYEIRIFTSSVLNHQDYVFFKSFNIRFFPIVKGEEFLTKVLESNYLLHLESDDFDSINKTRYSVSTKLPEYFSFKRLVIAFGPNCIASMELIINYNLGLFLDSSSTDISLNEQLNSIFNKDSNIYSSIVENAFLYSKKHFDKDKNSTNFKNIAYNKIS